MDSLASKVGRRGTVVLPAKLRRRLGIEEGSFVIAEEREDGILIRPATVLPVEIYEPRTPSRISPQQRQSTRKTIAARAPEVKQNGASILIGPATISRPRGADRAGRHRLAFPWTQSF